MAKLIHNGVEIANTLQRYDDVVNKPVINGAELKVGNNTSIDLGIVWKGTQDEYDALSEINPNTIYMIIEDEAEANDDDYNKLSNHPAINGVVLTGDKSLSSLNLYSKTEIDDLLSSSKSVIVVSKAEWDEIKGDPDKLHKNQVYYVSTDTAGVYENYLVDNNGIIYPLNSGSVDMDIYQLKHPVDGDGKDTIKAGDGTVVGALNTIGDVSTLTTIEKDTVVDAINELEEKTYDNTKYIRRIKGRFGEWTNTKKDRYFKLADITFTANYQTFNATLKLMTTYNTIKLTGAELVFNFRNVGAAASDLEVYEMDVNNVSADFPKGKVYVYINYNNPTAYPKKAEIWIRTVSSTYNEFTFEWQYRNTTLSGSLPTVNFIEVPAVAASIPSLGKQLYYDIYNLCSSRKSIEILNSAIAGRTRANLVELANGRSEYVFGSVGFSKTESPTGSANDTFNVHCMWQSSSKILLIATNPTTGLIYTSFYNGTSWSAWTETGATGDPGKLIDGTNDLTFTQSAYAGLQEKKYYYVDMGTYYINWIYLYLKYTQNSFYNSGKVGVLTGIKGKTSPKGDVAAPYFCSCMADTKGQWGHGNLFINQDGTVYMDISVDQGYNWGQQPWIVVETFISYK